MICTPCKNTRHAECKGESWCDCQHRTKFGAFILNFRAAFDFLGYVIVAMVESTFTRDGRNEYTIDRIEGYR